MAKGETLKLDDRNDIIVSGGDDSGLTFETIDGARSLAQDVRMRLSTWQGDDILHPENGLPYPDLIVTHEGVLINIIREELETVPRVQSVSRMIVQPQSDLEAQQRIINMAIGLNTAEGTEIGLVQSFEV